jgi:carbonic anhydrase/acetyltransferase-like protein (isoleucine patch superfamily)
MPLYDLENHAPSIDRQTGWIAPDAQIVGKIRIAKGSSAWFGAVLRGDNELIEIGARSNIQDHAILHTDPGFPLIVGDDCSVGHRAILHGCKIGNGCLIGMGAIVMNGAVIGEGSLVGAGALVTEGKKFPPRSMILGSPARQVKMLSVEECAGLKDPARRYVRNASRFRNQLILSHK